MRQMMFGLSIGARSRRRHHAAGGLAVVTPVPPAHTGIAYYNVRLLQAIAARRPIRVYADCQDADAPSPPHTYPLERFADLERTPVEPGRALMCFGNSHFHVGAWELLMTFGGDALLHEVSLCGLYLALDARGLLGESGVEGRTHSMEGRTLEAALSDRCAMTGEIVSAARRVFVHTEPARRLLVQRHPDRADDIAVVSFALPPARARRPPGPATVVASFGYMRAAPVVIDAFAKLVTDHPGAQLWLVGAELFAGQRDELEASLRAAGLDHNSTITGWVSEAEYHRRMAATTIAIQPRTHDFGERSAALGDLLAAGVPTIVSSTDSTAAIPGDAVIRVGIERGADGLATAAMGLLANRSHQRRLSRNARRYARAHDAKRAARELLRAIDSPPPEARHAGGPR